MTLNSSYLRQISKRHHLQAIFNPLISCCIIDMRFSLFMAASHCGWPSLPDRRITYITADRKGPSAAVLFWLQVNWSVHLRTTTLRCVFFPGHAKKEGIIVNRNPMYTNSNTPTRKIIGEEEISSSSHWQPRSVNILKIQFSLGKRLTKIWELTGLTLTGSRGSYGLEPPLVSPQSDL